MNRLEMILNSRNVWRWHIVNMARRQSVAEHSYLTWAIGMEMYRLGCKGHNTVEKHEFAEYLLTHDAEEAVTGDMPTPVKKALNAILPNGYERLRQHMLDGHWQHHDDYDNHWLGHLAKLADLTEAVLFCRDNLAPAEVTQYLKTHYAETLTDAVKRWPEFCEWELVEEVTNTVWDGY